MSYGKELQEQANAEIGIATYCLTGKTEATLRGEAQARLKNGPERSSPKTNHVNTSFGITLAELRAVLRAVSTGLIIVAATFAFALIGIVTFILTVGTAAGPAFWIAGVFGKLIVTTEHVESLLSAIPLWAAILVAFSIGIALWLILTVVTPPWFRIPLLAVYHLPGSYVAVALLEAILMGKNEISHINSMHPTTPLVLSCSVAIATSLSYWLFNLYSHNHQGTLADNSKQQHIVFSILNTKYLFKFRLALLTPWFMVLIILIVGLNLHLEFPPFAIASQFVHGLYSSHLNLVSNSSYLIGYSNNIVTFAPIFSTSFLVLVVWLYVFQVVWNIASRWRSFLLLSITIVFLLAPPVVWIFTWFSMHGLLAPTSKTYFISAISIIIIAVGFAAVSICQKRLTNSNQQQDMSGFRTLVDLPLASDFGLLLASISLVSFLFVSWAIDISNLTPQLQ